ncbi:diguanylate phosphodiesterase [Photobacterium aphoticum]|nr:EAL domain-containing protein [Photobacterium aphoticum]GHA32166.1 diguanylate phosphodiesterase [Photobacterium aphoticum]
MRFLFQPIYQPKTNATVYYEVLSQVESQSGDQYSSEDFFANIDNEFIKLLSICQLNYVANLEALAAPVSINIPLSTLLDAHFIQQLVDFSCLPYAIEITMIDTNCESSLLQKHIKQLKEAGIMIWLDDYHRDLAEANDTLGVIPWDFIKIDKTFLHHYQDIDSLRALAFTLSPFAEMGLIFEGIETSFENDLIAGVKALAQGYYFSFPKRWDDIENKTQKSSNEKLIQNQTHHTQWDITLQQAEHDETQSHCFH